MPWARWSNQDWTVWTPNITSSGSAASLGTGPGQLGRYMRDGSRVHIKFRITFGTSPTAGSGTYYVTTPIAPSANNNAGPAGSCFMYDSSAGVGVIASVSYDNNTGKMILDYGYNNAYGFATSGGPFIWAVNDVITGFAIYEV